MQPATHALMVEGRWAAQAMPGNVAARLMDPPPSRPDQNFWLE